MDLTLTLTLVSLLYHSCASLAPVKPKFAEPSAIDFSKCQLKSSCNPVEVNPCGCAHACCAPDVGLHEKYKGVTRNGALPFLYGYRCYKKPALGEICQPDALCPCVNNLRCKRKRPDSKIRRCQI